MRVRQRTSMVAGRATAIAAETTSGMAATGGELQPYRDRQRISTFGPEPPRSTLDRTAVDANSK